MGMAASQCRLLSLINRKGDIELRQMQISAQKRALACDMQRLSREYNDALSNKVLKWSNNNGATYVDLNYSTFMKPNSFNKNTPNMLTNHNGRVVLDDNYAKYAAMISPDGKPGGDWESNRTKILSEITGIPEEDINSSLAFSTELEANAKAVEELKNLRNKQLKKEPLHYITAANFAYLLDSSFQGTVTITSAGDLKAKVDSIKNSLSQYFINDDDLGLKDKTAFEKACDSFYISNQNFGQFANSNCFTEQEKDKKYNMDIAQVLTIIMAIFEEKVAEEGGKLTTETSSTGATKYPKRECNSDWQDWKAEYMAINAQYEAALEEYNSSVNTNAQAFDGEQEMQIAFYDNIFTSVAEKGWVEDDMITDPEYLNNQLLNGTFNITKMETKTVEEENESTGIIEKVEKHNYTSDIALNCSNIFQVNDDTEKALSKYEYEKSIINEKESRLDTRQQNLTTELSAIEQMMKSIEETKKNNIERTFSIFS